MRGIDKVVDIIIFLALFASMILLTNAIIFGKVLVMPISFLISVLVIAGIHMVLENPENIIK